MKSFCWKRKSKVFDKWIKWYAWYPCICDGNKTSCLVWFTYVEYKRTMDWYEEIFTYRESNTSS